MAQRKAKPRKSRSAVRNVRGDASQDRRGTRTVNDVMIRDIVTIEANATLLAAAERMLESNVGMLPVMQNGELRGVITDRDLVVRAMARDVRPSEGRVRDCLSEPVRCAAEDWTLTEAMEEMARQQVGRLPVLDDEGRVAGVVTLSSLALRSPKREATLDTARKVARRSARAA